MDLVKIFKCKDKNVPIEGMLIKRSIRTRISQFSEGLIEETEFMSRVNKPKELVISPLYISYWCPSFLIINLYIIHNQYVTPPRKYILYK